MSENEEYRRLYTELSAYENYGISMKLNNQPASPMQIVTAHMIREESSYMRDYVWDEKGHMKEIAFHNIKSSWVKMFRYPSGTDTENYEIVND